MRVLIAPDSFKGSLSAPDVAAALAAGWRRVRPDDAVVEMPVADGGEGTLDGLVHAWGGRIFAKTVTGPLGDPVEARLGVTPDGRTAVVEMAEASGLLLVPPSRRDPTATTSFGTGQLIRAALELGVDRIIVAVGGSGTNDGGAGMAEALGAKFFDEAGNPLPPGGGALLRLERVDVTHLDARLAQTDIVVAADVDNPLTGPRGASAVFGPQKGADPDDVKRLDAALTRFADVVEAARGVAPGTWRQGPGAGAAGGLGFGLLAFCGAAVRSGADVVLDAVGFDEELIEADLVIVGEGRLDAQSAGGKIPAVAARRAKRAGKPAVAVAGMLGSGYEELFNHGVGAAVSIAPGPMDVEASMKEAASLLQATGARLARLVQIGMHIGRRSTLHTVKEDDE